MRYAFMTLIAVYLITFFGCSTEEKVENEEQNQQAVTQIQQASPSEPQSKADAVEPETVVAPAEPKDGAEAVAPETEMAPAEPKDKAEAVAPETEMAPAEPKDEAEAVAPETVVTPVEPEQPESVEVVKADEVALSPKVEQKSVTSPTSLSVAIVQMQLAAQELLQLTEKLIQENNQLKALINTPSEEVKESEALQFSISTSKQLTDAIDNVEKSAQHLSEEAENAEEKSSSAKGEVTADETEDLSTKIDKSLKKSKEVAKDLTIKTVEATTTVFEAAHDTVEKAGDKIIDKLTEEKIAPQK